MPASNHMLHSPSPRQGKGCGSFFWRGACAALIFGLTSLPALAEIYQSPEDFVREQRGNYQAPETLWLTGDLQKTIRDILGHPYKSLRIRYWRNDSGTIWVLEDIGKTEYITLGFVITKHMIDRSKVLIFRESRGWEIKFPSFAEQFLGAQLTSGMALDRKIDGITGATLSVNAYERLARLALFLDASLDRDVH